MEKKSTIRKRHFRLQVSPAAFLLAGGAAVWAASAAAEEGIRPAALLLLGLAALIHELGHLAAAVACGVRITGMRLDLFGARLELPGLLSYRQELLVALGGPAANLLTATVLFRAWTACMSAMNALLILPVAVRSAAHRRPCPAGRWFWAFCCPHHWDFAP